MKTFPVICALFMWMPIFAASTSVTVYLLDHTGAQSTKTNFWIDWSESNRSIVATQVVTGELADKIINELTSSLKSTEAAHLCGHDPIYGIIATNRDGRQLKTSLCFKCLTWVKPNRRLNIAGKAGVDNKLCKMLREIIELPLELRN